MAPTFCKVEEEVAVKDVTQRWRTANEIMNSHTVKVIKLDLQSRLWEGEPTLCKPRIKRLGTV